MKNNINHLFFGRFVMHTGKKNSTFSLSTFNVTPSGAIELKDVGIDGDRQRDTGNKDWRSFWVDDTVTDHCFECQTFFGLQTRKVRFIIAFLH